MIEVRQTDIFANWFNRLRDRKAKARVQARIDRIELRIHYGPGYRVYFVRRGSVVVILLSGGDKSSQNADIKKAKEIAKQLED